MYKALQIICLSLITTVVALSQDSYFKTITLPDQFAASGRVIQSDGMDIYINSIVPCIDGLDTFSCMSVSKHNEYGELDWFRKIEGSIISNDQSLLISNDSLFVSSQRNPKDSFMSYQLLMFDKHTGESLGAFKKELPQYPFVNNNG